MKKKPKPLAEIACTAYLQQTNINADWQQCSKHSKQCWQRAVSAVKRQLMPNIKKAKADAAIAAEYRKVIDQVLGVLTYDATTLTGLSLQQLQRCRKLLESCVTFIDAME